MKTLNDLLEAILIEKPLFTLKKVFISVRDNRTKKLIYRNEFDIDKPIFIPEHIYGIIDINLYCRGFMSLQVDSVKKTAGEKTSFMYLNYATEFVTGKILTEQEHEMMRKKKRQLRLEIECDLPF